VLHNGLRAHIWGLKLSLYSFVCHDPQFNKWDCNRLTGRIEGLAQKTSMRGPLVDSTVKEREKG